MHWDTYCWYTCIPAFVAYLWTINVQQLVLVISACSKPDSIRATKTYSFQFFDQKIIFVFSVRLCQSFSSICAGILGFTPCGLRLDQSEDKLPGCDRIFIGPGSILLFVMDQLTWLTLFFQFFTVWIHCHAFILMKMLA